MDPFYETGEIMGRSVANEGFLDALLRLDPFDEYHFFLAGKKDSESVLRKILTRHSGFDPGRVGCFSRMDLPRALATTPYHCFHLSDCMNHPPHLAALRNAVSTDIFPITSVTHSLSYTRYAERMLAHMWAGTTTRDAILATSRSAMDVLSRWFGTLRDAYSLSEDRFVLPAVERVPLGVAADAMIPASAKQRQELRRERGMTEDCCVILIFGRISHSSKMDLLPVFRALQRLLAQGMAKNALRIELAGFVRTGERDYKTLEELAGNLGIDFNVTASPDHEEKQALFACADVFLSPSDNLQETFGLSLLEASLMELPVIASDFDGYRDLVAHGETGLLLPTTGPAETGDVDRLSRVWFDNQYHLLLAQRTAVDVGSMAQALQMLIENPQQRRDMGKAGRAHVLEHFTWDVMVRHCVRTWNALRDRPVDRQALRSATHPLQVDFGHVFGAYPSRQLGPDMELVRSRAGEAVYRGQEFFLIYGGVSEVVEQEAVRALMVLARKATSVETLETKLAETADVDRPRAQALILWCLKHDLLEPVNKPRIAELTNGRADG